MPIGRTHSTSGILRLATVVACVAFGGTEALVGQSLNFDFDPGTGGSSPPASYGAAGLAGEWNAIPAAHGTTTGGLVDVDGLPTSVTARQIGGLALAEQADPAITGYNQAAAVRQPDSRSPREFAGPPCSRAPRAPSGPNA